MKKFLSMLALALCIGFLVSTASCVVKKHDNGKHKGWYKNKKNPHNPETTNPGKTKNNPKKGN